MKTPLLLSDLPMKNVTAESARQLLAEIEAECLRQALAIAFAEIEKDLLHGGCQIFFPKDLERFIPKVAANLKARGFSVCQISSETLLDAAITVTTRPWIGVTWTKPSLARTASKKFAKEPSGVSTKCLSYAKMLFNGSGATENRVLEFVANNPGVGAEKPKDS